ncbi:tetratricopeptide repeat containing protein [Rhodotorula toruloides]|uniref:Tetratricopeptide repeat containing protein n=1 Tax=Rhodotorula toruloides TaxID=5286 RepID=A0A511KFW6_RHOTO|nr:tetratricopeptide repeat containing protein [Rhodotorula toruloides]
MAIEALAAVGAAVQILKTLYEYYNIHKRNKALLDILESFSANVEIAFERLKAREDMLSLGQNDALSSIERDFTNAKNWLVANDKNLRSVWTALQAADKLKDLDDRLTKAFASKMSIAIFTALQDTRAGVIKIQTTLEGMPTNLSDVCRTSTKEAIHEAISELKQEAYAAVGGSDGRDRGFRNGEAEKIISQLVDQLAEQERIKEDEELFFEAGYAPLEPTKASPVPYAPASSSASRRSSQYIPASVPSDLDNPFEPSSSRANSISSHRPYSPSLRSSTLVESDSESTSTVNSAKGKEPLYKVPSDSVLLNAKDAATGVDLIDPVLGTDGKIYDRWTLAEPSPVIDDSLRIVGDVVQLRNALFASFPDRQAVFDKRRRDFERKTLDLYFSASYNDLPRLADHLSHVLLYDPTSISLRVRRGLVYYRLRFIQDALVDLNEAVQMSGASKSECASVDALRFRALVLEELHDTDAALRDVDAVLSIEPNDVLSLSLRASVRGNAGSIAAGKADLVATNAAIRSGQVYRSKLGDSDCDLEYLARGWAYSVVRDFAAAAADFEFSASLRNPPDPYATACHALAKLKDVEARGALSSEAVAATAVHLDDGIERIRKVALSTTEVYGARCFTTSGAPVFRVQKDEGLPPAVFPTLLLRASARATQGDFELALHDFETGMRLRPPCVRDAPNLRSALAELRIMCGDREGAEREFDLAMAAAAGREQRADVVAQRRQHGL